MAEPILRITIGTGSFDYAWRSHATRSDRKARKMKLISPSSASPGQSFSTNLREPTKGFCFATDSMNSALEALDNQDIDALIEQAFAKTANSMEAPWHNGDLSPDKIAAAIEIHRASHPYTFD